MTSSPRFIPAFCAIALGATLLTPSAQALTSVAADNGAAWNVNDSRRPGLDTGSIRNVSNSKLEAFGSLFLEVEGGTDPMNGQMLRGFGLTQQGPQSYASTASVRLDGINVARSLDVNRTSGTGTFFDTFTNTTTAPITLKASFGGALGYGTAGNAGTVSATADGDATLETADTWMVATTAGAFRPTGVVVGSTGADALGNHQKDPFTAPYTPGTSAQNYPGFVRELTIEPGATASLLHYVHVGARGDSAGVVAATEALALDPDLGALSTDQICTVSNWDLATLPGFDAATCAGADPLQLPAAPEVAPVRTSIDYDVTGKTVEDLRRDLLAGTVTSVEITQAFLDRIKAYDQTQLGIKSFIHVAEDALEQAAEADAKIAAGGRGPLLGIPIAIKDLYDVEGQPNTGGIMSLATWQPESDAFQIAAIRAAGAVFLGKTNLSEFANSGSWSESGFMQSWNGLYPSKSSFGSSGGSAAAVAAELAPISMGTQTGVSLYAPATGASLTSFRGTDGLTSAEGVMPLTWAQDYAGPIGQSVGDVALVLDATSTRTTGNNPDDILTSRVDNTLRPTSFTAGLDASALKGKKIGYLPGSYSSSLISDDSTGAETFAHIRAAVEAAGGEMVEITTPMPGNSTAGLPVSGNAGAHGWLDYINSEPTFPFRTPKAIWENMANLPYNVSSTDRVGHDEQSVTNALLRRDRYKALVGEWMAAAGVDAVAYPGFISQMGNNDATSAALSSDRASGVPTSNVGLPTVILPIGVTSHGYSNSLQLVGPAWSDAEVLAMGYAVEQQAKARVRSQATPALAYAGPAESLLGLELATTRVTRGQATTATVTVSSTRKPTGPVTITVDGQTVTGTLSDGRATVTLPSRLSVGTHLVVAHFAGTTKVAASEATAQLKVDAGTPTISLAPVSTSTQAGKPMALTVTASSPAGAVSSGTVLIRKGGRVLTSATLGSNGTARVNVKGLAVGTHRLTAQITPTAELGQATSKVVTVKVTKATARLKARTTAKKVTVTVTSSGKVSGKVRLMSRGKVLATSTVRGGKATFTVRGKLGSATRVTATYLGNGQVKKASLQIPLK